MRSQRTSTTQQCDSQAIKSDVRPLIDLFDLLLEWEMKDVQEKAETPKEV